MTVSVQPDPFTLIEYDAAVIGGIVDDSAAKVGLPSNVDIELVVDEVLFAPLVGSEPARGQRDTRP